MDTSTSLVNNHNTLLHKLSSSVSTLSSGAGLIDGGGASGSMTDLRQKLSKSPSDESLRSHTSSASGGGGNGAGSAQQPPMGNKGYRPDEAVRTFGNKLTQFEHTEIVNYSRVYFVGSQAKKRAVVIGANNNNGFDDENGSYLLVAHDHVAYRYEVLKVIGKGSFGQVST
jgi:dual specificity tyrosine-phosphorylation-regulated kinase 2/3/4